MDALVGGIRTFVVPIVWLAALDLPRPEAELTLHAETSVCWATAHMQQAMKRWTDANGRDNPAANALTAHLTC